MQQLGEISKAVILSLAISGATAVYNLVINSANQEQLLRSNIEATQELSKSLNELRYQFVAIPNTYATRQELKELMQEIKEQRAIRRTNDGS
jgi:predicted RNA-binding protein with EMAP domain